MAARKRRVRLKTPPLLLEKTQSVLRRIRPALADEALADELKQFVKSRLAPHKYPRQLEFIAELPKTATGKIQRFRLREQGQRRP